MFTFEQIETIHIEITNRCQASCPMCARNINGGIENPNLKLGDWSLEDFKKIINEDVLNQKIYLTFCGCFGDPIVNKNLMEMCQYVVNTNPNIGIGIHTNGGAKDIEWWAEMAHILPKMHLITFALDGLEDTHSLYRIGTTYEKVISNARSFINAGGRASWAFIKFKHNKHQVKEAEQRAKEYGFIHFELKETNRFINGTLFPVIDRKGNFLYNLEPPTDSKMVYVNKEIIKNYKNVIQDANIDCVAKKIKTIYIDALKNVFPCDFLAAIPYHYYNKNDMFNDISKVMNEQYRDLLKDLKNNNALSRSIKDIINSNEWQNIWEKYWNGENKMIKCASTCGKLNKFSPNIEQYLEMKNINGSL